MVWHYMYLICIYLYWVPLYLTQPLGMASVQACLYVPTQTSGEDQYGHLQSPAWLPLGHVSDLITCKLYEEFDVFHNTKYPYWNQLSLAAGLNFDLALYICILIPYGVVWFFMLSITFLYWSPNPTYYLVSFCLLGCVWFLFSLLLYLFWCPYSEICQSSSSTES